MKRARKVGGSFEADGTVVSEFSTTSGERRVVFEFDVPKGMLHIYRPDQLVVLEPFSSKSEPFGASQNGE